MTALRVGVVGAGAIGCTVAFGVAGAGGPPPAVLARGAGLAALRQAGVTRLDGTRRSRAVTASDDPAALGEQDVLVLSTKVPALSELAPRLRPMIGPHTAILPLVNGVPWWFFGEQEPRLQLRSVDPDGAIAAALPRAQVVGAVVNLSCSSPEPGCVQRTAGNKISIGPTAADGDDRVRTVGELLRRSGFEVVETGQIRELVWYKLLGNASFNPISALTRATGDRIASDPAVRAICVQMMEEAIAVAAAFGLSVSGSTENRIAVAESLGRFKTSMLQDAEAERPLEHAALIGALVEIADHFGVAVPVTRVVHGLVRLQDEAAQGRRAERADPPAAPWQDLRSMTGGR